MCSPNLFQRKQYIAPLEYKTMNKQLEYSRIIAIYILLEIDISD